MIYNHKPIDMKLHYTLHRFLPLFLAIYAGQYFIKTQASMDDMDYKDCINCIFFEEYTEKKNLQVSCLLRIAKNIIENPDTKKYQSIKYKVACKNFFGCNHCMNLLVYSGFERKGEKMVFDMSKLHLLKQSYEMIKQKIKEEKQQLQQPSSSLFSYHDQFQLVISCICGFNLKKTINPYPLNLKSRISCDRCEKICAINQPVYHCPLGKGPRYHQNGYDLCLDCAMIFAIEQGTLDLAIATAKQKNDKKIDSSSHKELKDNDFKEPEKDQKHKPTQEQMPPSYNRNPNDFWEDDLNSGHNASHTHNNDNDPPYISNQVASNPSSQPSLEN